MYATLRRLRCNPGRAADVGRLIEAEYVPQLADVEGVLSYTLVAVGDDEVTSMEPPPVQASGSIPAAARTTARAGTAQNRAARTGCRHRAQRRRRLAGRATQIGLQRVAEAAVRVTVATQRVDDRLHPPVLEPQCVAVAVHETGGRPVKLSAAG
jgi:hypothetical protein